MEDRTATPSASTELADKNPSDPPQLVITSEKDFRIPYTQGIAAFTALQRREIPSRLLIFPDENHWVLKPKNSVQWYDEVFAWFGKYLKQ